MVGKEKIKRKKRNIKLVRNIIYVILAVLFYFSLFVKIEFNDVSFEQLLFTLTKPEGANYDIVWRGLLFVGLFTGGTIFLVWLINKGFKFLQPKVVFKFGFNSKKITKIFSFDLFKMTKFRHILYFLVIFIGSLFVSFKLLDLDDYIKSQLVHSNLFEEYYVDPHEVNITFNGKKKNLIYIFVESLEISNVSIKNGGLVNKSYTPNLEKLALENINFSNSSKLGGAIQLKGTTWTMAGLVSQTAGIPLKVPINLNVDSNYSDSLPGAYTIGEVLEDNGYKNYFMFGSDANYGGRKLYFEQHGNYEIFDYYSAIDKGYINDNYYVWWGYEDKKLFDYAKKKLTSISKKDEPFNFTMLTADTHFTDGYLDSTCETPFDSKYANAFYCSDQKIADFIEWCKKQDFYEDTAIVIVGDHLTMQSGFYSVQQKDYRYLYNVFINSSVTTEKEKNRKFSHFDIYPTTLAALGATVEGDKLGLGVNLFSDEQTLIEKFDSVYLNTEIAKKSFYYDENILGDSYYDMIKNN